MTVKQTYVELIYLLKGQHCTLCLKKQHWCSIL